MSDATPRLRTQHQRAFLGIDLGTSSVKAVLTDEQGAVLSRANCSYPIESPHPTWSETDPELWWSGVVTAVRAVTAGSPCVVGGIGLSGQMHGLVVADDTGRALRPAITWADSRAVDQLSLYRMLPAQVRTRLANPWTPGMAGPLLAWLQDNEPDTYRNTRWALQPKDWVRARLTGLIAAEPSDASATLLYDVTADGWDVEAVVALGLDPAMLPPMFEHSGAPAGAILAEAAAELGLALGITVAAGAGDSAAAVFASGLAPGQAQITVGTGAQIIVPVAAPHAPMAEPVVTHLYRDATPHGWYEMAAIQSGGLVLTWVAQVLGASWAELYESAQIPARADDPIFLPHLTGERTPYLDPTMRGAWTGLQTRHDRSDLLRSALEGVAFTLAEALDSLTGLDDRIDHLRIAGGGSTNPSWQQLLADVLGFPLRAVHVADASGRGAALLGACAAGDLDHARAAALPIPAALPVADPNQQLSQLYAERRHLFRQALEALRHPHSNDRPSAPAQRSSA